MTSSDVLDTCLIVQLVRAADILIADIDKVLAALKKRAFEHKMTPTIGRTHGIHAEPVTFGLKLAFAYAEFTRARERLIAARKEVATCAISGAVGTFAQIDPRVEAHVAQGHGTGAGADFDAGDPARPPRDVFRDARRDRLLGRASRHRNPASATHRGAGGGRFFSEGQKGPRRCRTSATRCCRRTSPASPRMVRAYVTPAMENVVLWHERDISHSSVERMIAPDATVTLDFALNRLAGLIEKLLVYPRTCRRTSTASAAWFIRSGLLIALTQKGASREDAYRLVQRMRCRYGAAKATSRRC